MRWKEIISERLAQERVHHNPSVGAIKALTKEGTQRFVISKDGDLYMGDAFQYTHQQIFPAMMATAVRGYFYFKDGEFVYRTMGPCDNLPRDHDLLRTFERAGIHPMKAEALHEGKTFELNNLTVWFDPSRQQLANLVKTEPLRGLVTDKHLVVWSAYADVHENVRDDLVKYAVMSEDEASWAEKICLDQEGSNFADFDYWENDPTVINGIAILSDGGFPKSPALMRALGPVKAPMMAPQAEVEESFMDKVSSKLTANTKPDKVTPQRGRTMPGSDPLKNPTRRKRYM